MIFSDEAVVQWFYRYKIAYLAADRLRKHSHNFGNQPKLFKDDYFKMVKD